MERMLAMASHVAPSATGRQVLLGMPFDPFTLDDAVLSCQDALAGRRRMLVGVVNAAKAVNLRRDPLLRDSLLECDMLLADGQSVVWAGRILRKPLPERVAGIDLFEALLELADREGRSVFLLGARPDVLATVISIVGSRWPGVVIAGARDGYFTDEEAPSVAAEIRGSSPDMLFLGMTSPRKEIFLSCYGDTLNVPILHGVGGSFDVVAGVVKRAPARWQRVGMEWAYRLMQEPGRLWQRYLRTNTTFLALVVKDMVNPTPLYVQEGASRG
jgi:N-acetylglucosaminyldiphosphoundecaprenol N-acetyl-beta-D-mannosaminyltransferase